MPPAEFVLSSDRLGFRPFEDTDFEDLKALDTNPEVRAHFPESVLTADQVSERISKNRTCYRENGFSDFAVIERQTGLFAGRAGAGHRIDSVYRKIPFGQDFQHGFADGAGCTHNGNIIFTCHLCLRSFRHLRAVRSG